MSAFFPLRCRPEPAPSPDTIAAFLARAAAMRCRAAFTASSIVTVRLDCGTLAAIGWAAEQDLEEDDCRCAACSSLEALPSMSRRRRCMSILVWKERGTPASRSSRSMRSSSSRSACSVRRPSSSACRSITCPHVTLQLCASDRNAVMRLLLGRHALFTCSSSCMTCSRDMDARLAGACSTGGMHHRSSHPLPTVGEKKNVRS